MRPPSGGSSAKRSSESDCRISIPTASGRTLVALGEKLCTTPEQFKAWSQNLAHENVLTTFISYGAVTSNRQADILAELSKSGISARDGDPDERTVQQVVAYLQKKAY